MPVRSKSLDLIERSLQAAALRHQVISNNIANANVPGFLPSEVNFEEQLQKALAQSDFPPPLMGLMNDPRHIPISPQKRTALPTPLVSADVTGGAMRPDGNALDLEAEMAKLAANQLWYQMLVRSMGDELGRMRTVITEGRR